MTRQLDLRTGRPVWAAYRAPAVPCAPLTRDARTDVVVVGMGISGAMIADELSAAGLGVIMIDRRGPMKGSTPATTALVQYEIDQPLIRLGRMIGKANAETAWRRSRLAVANLSSRIDRLSIDCRMAERPSYLLAGNEMGPGDLRQEAEARRSAGLSAEYLTRGALADRLGVDREGAIVSPSNLALDPRRLTAGLLLAARDQGARFHAPVELTAYESSSDEVLVATSGGPTIRCSVLVLATGYELAPGVPEKGHRLISTWALATRPQPDKLWPEQAFIWEASDPYLYLRATSDGRVICGGEDEPFSDEAARDTLIAAKTARIAEKLARLLPDIDTEPVFAWAGAFGTTATGLPIIAPLPRKPRVIAIMGYGGNGITYSRIAAEIVRAHVEGRTDSDAALFAFPD